MENLAEILVEDLAENLAENPAEDIAENLVENLVNNLLENLVEDLAENLLEYLVEDLAENIVENFCSLEQKFQLLTPPPKVWVSMFPNINGNEKLASAIMKNRKKALVPQKCALEQNCQLPPFLKFGSLVFQVSREMENWHQPL